MNQVGSVGGLHVCATLERLSLHHNRLVSIDESLLVHLKRLQHVDIGMIHAKVLICLHQNITGRNLLESVSGLQHLPSLQVFGLTT